MTTNRTALECGLVLALLAMALGIGGHGGPLLAQTDQADAWIQSYEPQVHEGMPYRLLRPYGFDPSERYPVIVSLHGGAGRGTDNRRQLRVWTRHLADPKTRSDFPGYVLAPQSTRLWDGEHLRHIKAVVSSLPSVDSDRIYVLGHSMGGHGSFVLLQIDPAYFAAAVPSAGTGRGTDEEFIDPSRIRKIPIWALHGDKDEVCPYERSPALLEEMAKIGGRMRLTTWVGDGHSVGAKLIPGGSNGVTRCSYSGCVDEPSVLDWLFAQSRSDSR